VRFTELFTIIYTRQHSSFTPALLGLLPRTVHALFIGCSIEHPLACLLAVTLLHRAHDFLSRAFVIFVDWHLLTSDRRHYRIIRQCNPAHSAGELPWVIDPAKPCEEWIIRILLRDIIEYPRAGWSVRRQHNIRHALILVVSRLVGIVLIHKAVSRAELAIE